MSPDDDKKRQSSEMTAYLNQYLYRKEMGLSWDEFEREPLGILAVNTLIIALTNQRRNKMRKK